MFKAWTIGWAGWVGDKRFLKAWRGSWHWGDCPDLKTESIGERCIWGPGTGRGPTVTTHTSRIQSSVCMGATWHTTLYAYRQQPFKVLPEGIYNIQWTGHPITAANANQYHLLLRMRHQMLWAPPSKLPLFSLTGTVVSWGEKSQKTLKCFSGFQCGCPADTFSWCCLNRMHSQSIVRAGEGSDRDAKEANRRAWQTYIMWVCWLHSWSSWCRQEGSLPPRPKSPSGFQLVGHLVVKKAGKY